jgi:hypothetical protein
MERGDVHVEELVMAIADQLAVVVIGFQNLAVCVDQQKTVQGGNEHGAEFLCYTYAHGFSFCLF